MPAIGVLIIPGLAPPPPIRFEPAPIIARFLAIGQSFHRPHNGGLYVGFRYTRFSPRWNMKTYGVEEGNANIFRFAIPRFSSSESTRYWWRIVLLTVRSSLSLRDVIGHWVHLGSRGSYEARPR